jgi:RNA polymerase sigma factor (sigma-70 family)
MCNDFPATSGDVADRRARFEALTLPLSSALFGFAVKLIRDRDRAADLVQEAFLRAYRTFDGFRPGTNAKAWLFQIVYSIFVNEYHKQRRRPREVSMDELEQRYQRSLDIPDWDACRAVLENPALERRPGEVEQALAALPDSFRQAMLLVDVGELSYEEAAKVMDCPLGTLRSRLHRARKLLAIELQDYARRIGYIEQ